MSYTGMDRKSDNLKIPVGGYLFLGTRAAGSKITSSSTGNIEISSTAASSITTTGDNLTISTATSGDISFTSADDMTVDSGGALTIGTTNATSVTLGKSGTNVTVNGNLIVSGSTTTINSTTTVDTSNLLVLNSGPASSGYDGGVLVNRSAADIVADDNVLTSTTDVTSSSNTGNKIGLNGSDSTSEAGMYIKLTGSLLTGQYKEISSITSGIATLDSEFTPEALTGTAEITSSGTALTITSGNTNELTVGAIISDSNSGEGSYWYVDSITNSSTAVLTGSTNDLAAGSTIYLIAPGQSIGYSVYNKSMVGFFYQETNDTFVLASTLDSAPSSQISVQSYLDLRIKDLTANALTLSGTTATSYSSGFSGSVITLSGGIGTTSNIMLQTDADSVSNTPLYVSQTNSSGGYSTMTLEQADTAEGFINFNGASTSSTAVTGSLVVGSGNGNLEDSIAGYAMVKVVDSNSNITDGTYYVALHSLSAI